MTTETAAGARIGETLAAIPVFRPTLPTADRLLPYLRRIDGSHWYSNFGPLEVELTARLAAHFGLDGDAVLLAASGTAGLTAALLAVARPGRPLCLVPSWTFAASTGAALAAGLTPHFVDVDATTWALDPVGLRRRDDLDRVAAVMVTVPFGEPIDTAAWDAFTAETGIPVIIDAAAAFGALDRRIMAVGRSPVVVSLHATKTFGIGEGGLLLSRDTGLVERAMAAINFGFRGSREARLPGFNGKLSEFAAAVGHAVLDNWPKDCADWHAAMGFYREHAAAFARLGDLRLPPDAGWPTSTLNILARDAATALAIEHRLGEVRIDTRRWWGGGCHVQAAYRHLPRDPLPVTDDLAARCIGLPMRKDLTEGEVARIAGAISSLAA